MVIAFVVGQRQFFGGNRVLRIVSFLLGLGIVGSALFPSHPDCQNILVSPTLAGILKM
jgi:hypothetical protein